MSESVQHEPSVAMSASPLRDLLVAVSQGGAESFRSLYALTYRRLFAIVFRIVRQREDSEEILQEVFLKVWLRSELFDENRGEAGAWLGTIATRSAFDLLKRRSRRVKEVLCDFDEAFHLEFESHLKGPADSLLEHETRQTLAQSLGQLPSEQQVALDLAFAQEKTHFEIAEMLECPVGTVKSRIRRGLRSMATTLQTSGLAP